MSAIEHRRNALATLRHRDFRLLWIGQLISVVGDQIQVVAIAWHIYVLTGSALQLGLVGLARAVPYMTLTMVGGAVADSMDRRRMLVWTQAFQMIVSGWLVYATFSGNVNAGILYVVTFLGGAAQAFDQPARGALVPNVIPPEELSNGFAMMTLLRNTTMIIGPGIGGVLIATVGLSWSYAANGISFLGLMAAVLLMTPIRLRAAASGSNWDKVVGGLRFALAQPLVLMPLLIDFATRISGGSRALLPIFAKDIFKVGPQGLGWMNSAPAVGAVIGGLLLGSAGPLARPLMLMVTAYVVEGLSLVGVGLSPNLYVALGALLVMGFCGVFAEVPRNTVVQMLTPDELRGRVTALASIFTSGGPMLGQLDAGAVATVVGAPIAAVLCGSAMALATIVLALSPSMRKGYQTVQA